MLRQVAPGWGFDCSTVISPELVDKIVGTPLPNGQAVSFVFRYVSRHAPFSQSDITAPEAQRIINAGLTLLLVQHAQYPNCPVDGDNGTALGKTAAEHAKSIGYPPGAYIFFDLEGVGDSGQPVLDCLRNWESEVHAAGYKAGCYVGYQTGVTPAQLGQLDFDGWWCDFAQRVPPKQGFMCHQSVQVTYLGFPVDPDHAYPDLLGRGLVGMAADSIDVAKMTYDAMLDPISGEPL